LSRDGRENMSLYRLLQNPLVYDLKSRILSLGRQSVLDYLSTRIKLPANSRVLDVGCGTGRHATAFSGSFYGGDLNPHYIRHAKQQYAGDFLVMDATGLAFAENYFDLVFCVGLCHHLSDDDVRATVREMIRMVKPGGQVLIIDGVFPLKTNLSGHLLFTFDRGNYTRTLDVLTNLLAPEGFQLLIPNIPGSYPYQRAVFTRYGRVCS